MSPIRERKPLEPKLKWQTDVVDVLKEGHGSLVDADKVDGKHASEIGYVSGDFLPDINGRFLGETGRAWDGSKLINLVETQIPVLTDAKYPNALLLDGSRAMIDTLRLEQAVNDAIHIGSATLMGKPIKIYGNNTGNINIYIDPEIGYGIIVSYYDTDPPALEKQYVQMYATADGAYIYLQSDYSIIPHSTVDFSAVGNRAGFDASVTGGYEAILWAGAGLGLSLFGEEYVLFGSVASLPVGTEENGWLETYRGKMIRVEGGAGVADEVYICKWNGTAYKWFKINMTEV